MNKNIAADEIYALLLCGGKSSRMGQDKGLFVLKKDGQKIFSFEHGRRLLRPCFQKTFLSLRPEQWPQYKNYVLQEDVIFDENKRWQGPLAGILSAQQKFPHVHWFVLACDMFAFDEKIIHRILREFHAHKKSTCFFSFDASGEKRIETFAAVLHWQKLADMQRIFEDEPEKKDKKFYSLHNLYRTDFHFLEIADDEKKYFLNCNRPCDVPKILINHK